MLEEGTTINNRYRIAGVLQSNSIFNLYEAQDIKVNMYCILKEYCPSPGENRQDSPRRFEEQARLLGKIQNYNFLRVKDYFISDGKYYLVTDHLQGEYLSDLLSRSGSPGLPEEDVREFGIKICGFLKYLHNFNPPIFYKELKPSDIIISQPDKRLLLSDFGIIEAISSPGNLKKLLVKEYRAPEIETGNSDSRCDIYSAGVLLYKLLTGSTPDETGRTPVKELLPLIDRSFEYAIKRALEENPDDRFSGAEEMEDVLSGTVLVKDETIEILSLIEKLKSPVPLIREEAKKELTETKRERAIEVLINILSEERDEIKKIIAIENLVLLSDSRGNKAIIELLEKDPSPGIREKAAGALGILKYETALEPLIKALHDENKKVVFKAIWALGEFKDDRVIKAFTELIATSQDQELRRQLKMTLSRAFPDAEIIDEKAREAKQKELAGGINNIFSFVTNWKVILVVVVLVLVGIIAKTMLETGSLNLFRPKLTKEMYLDKINSIEKRKDEYVKAFKESLEKIYVTEEETVNQAHCIELSGHEEKFMALEREFESFSPPDEYKELNDKIKGAIKNYQEACQYAFNVYDPVKLQKALNYNEVMENIEGRLKEADKIIAGAKEEMK